MRHYTVLLGALLVAGLASATTIIPHTLKERAAAADRVVIADVLSRRVEVAEANPMKMKTIVELRVRQTLKGDGAVQLTVVQIGGDSGGYSMHVPGDAVFYPGEQALLFLKCDGTRCALVAFGEGKVEIVGKDAMVHNLFTNEWEKKSLADVLRSLELELPAKTTLPAKTGARTGGTR